MRVVAVVPAYQAGSTVAQVVRDLRRMWPGADTAPDPIVVDDGSSDGTAERAAAAGAKVVRHEHNRGKGAALRTGLTRARELGADTVVTVDADGQHPAEEAARLAAHPASDAALVLAVRNLARDGAPRSHRFSNAVSNFFLSRFAGQRLADTQCGLRRYPIEATLALGARDTGYAFEAEVVLRAARAGLPIEQVPVRVSYPPSDQHTSHFRRMRDPARIVLRVLHTWLSVPASRPRRRRWRAWLVSLLAAGLTLYAIHLGIGWRARLTPPQVAVPAGRVQQPRPDLRRFGDSYRLVRGKLVEVGLRGNAEQIGFAHARLLREPMLEIERALYQRFERRIRWDLARTLLLDLAQLRYAHVDEGMSPPRQRELAAMALGIRPDPLEGFFPSYQRLVYLHALYDIALSFERSPLVGCTSFVLSGPAAPDGGALLARAFDFDVDEVFDRRKAVFLVHEDGAIPFASVAWPGLIGVLSGMNREGVAVVVHGARAGAPRTAGEPVVHALRRVLSQARDAEQAVTALGERDAMVSHLVIVADVRGRAAVVERLPGRSLSVRWLPARAAVTNHFEGPAADDPSNHEVCETTSTLVRRQRGDELVAALSGRSSPREAMRLLRDRRGSAGRRLPLGDRRAIDALIATHGVVMDTARRVLWVSESPHLLGRFVGFDLGRMLAPSYDPSRPRVDLEALPEDPLLSSGEYDRWRASRGR